MKEIIRLNYEIILPYYEVLYSHPYSNSRNNLLSKLGANVGKTLFPNNKNCCKEDKRIIAHQLILLLKVKRRLWI